MLAESNEANANWQDVKGAPLQRGMLGSLSSKRRCGSRRKRKSKPPRRRHDPSREVRREIADAPYKGAQADHARMAAAEAAFVRRHREREALFSLLAASRDREAKRDEEIKCADDVESEARRPDAVRDMERRVR